MEKTIIGLVVCIMLFAIGVPLIEVSAKQQPTLPQLPIDLKESSVHFTLNATNWEYKTNDIQIFTTRNASHPWIGTLSSYPSQQFQQFRNTEFLNRTIIHEESTHQVVVMKYVWSIHILAYYDRDMPFPSVLDPGTMLHRITVPYDHCPNN